MGELQSYENNVVASWTFLLEQMTTHQHSGYYHNDNGYHPNGNDHNDHDHNEHHHNEHRHHGPFRQTPYRRYHPSATVISGGTAACLVCVSCHLLPIIMIIIIMFQFRDGYVAGVIVPVAVPLGLLIIVVVVCLLRALRRRQNVSHAFILK